MTKTKTQLAAIALGAALAIGSAPQCALAASAADFYKGKTLTIIVGYSAGGGFDRYARVFAEFYPKHIAGVDNVIVQNMPGAGSMKAANYVYNVAPQDGTYLVIFNENLSLNQVLKPKGMKVDVRKFQWIGRLGMRTSVGIAWHTSGIKNIQDLRRKTLVVGGTTGNDYGTQVVRAMNAFAGTKFKVVHGYKGSKGIYLAMERGEVQGMNIAAAEDLLGRHADWLRDHKIAVLHINNFERLPQFPDVPTIVELAKNDEQRQIMSFLASKIAIGRSFVLGPKVPKDRVALLRRSFDATVKDKALLAAAKKRQVDVSPMSGEKLEAMIERVIDIPPARVRRLKALLLRKKKG